MSDQDHAEKDPPPAQQRREDLLGTDEDHPRKAPLDPMSAALQEEAKSENQGH